MLKSLNVFFRNVLQRRFVKYVFPPGLLLLIGAAVFAVLVFATPQHVVEIDMASDHDGTAQLFWIAKGGTNYKELFSFRAAIKPGSNHLKFSLPLSRWTKFRQLRFDPTEKAGGKFEIAEIRYTHMGNAVYRLPLRRLRNIQTEGIAFDRISDGKASMTALTRDPIIGFSRRDLEKCALPSSKIWKDIAALCVITLLAWIVALHCSRKYWSAFYPGLAKVIPGLAKATYFLLFVATLAFLWYKAKLLAAATSALLLLYGVKYLCFREWKKEKTPEPARPNFDWGMHYFRALAIACICLGHTVWGARKGESWGQMFFQADSVYFLFISGYLAQFLFLKRPDHPLVYYKKKIVNVISPYVVFSTLILTFIYFTHPRSPLYNGPFTWRNIALAFCFGKAAVAYWYIPFVAVLFLWTPLLVRLPSKIFMQVLFVFASLAIIFPQRGRFGNLEGFVYLYTYFTFSYLLGMAFSRYRGPMEEFFRRNCLWALLLAIGIGILIGWNPAWKLTISIFGLLCSFQKILFTMFFIVALGFLKNRKIRILSLLAEFSFTIYFIHLIFYEDYEKIYNALISFTSWDNALTFITGVIFLFHMLLLSILLKKIFGKYSRYFIGS